LERSEEAGRSAKGEKYGRLKILDKESPAME
jgi:hypothetical protein